VAEVERLRDASPLAAVLRDGRGRFNAAFAAARRANPRVDPAAFSAFLCGPVDDILRAVASSHPRQVTAVCEALWEAALTLFAQDLLGPASRTDVVARAWEDVLPVAARLLAESPESTIAAVSNAACNIDGDLPGAGNRWLPLVRALVPHAADVAAFREAMLVAAWRAGLAHYRDSALARWRGLPAALQRVVLGLPPTDPRTSAELAARLDDPWWTPEGEAHGRPAIALVGAVGGFVGLGGPFVEPPQVACVAGAIVAFDRAGAWTVFADANGTTIKRARSMPDSRTDLPAPTFTIDRRGTVACGGEELAFPDLADATSFASTPWLLAVTVAHSHRVFLVARVVRSVAP
jgi:hypothetical protein